jgi:hypothetical protein
MSVWQCQYARISFWGRRDQPERAARRFGAAADDGRAEIVRERGDEVELRGQHERGVEDIRVAVALAERHRPAVVPGREIHFVEPRVRRAGNELGRSPVHRGDEPFGRCRGGDDAVVHTQSAARF